MCACAPDRQRRFRVPSDECDTQETHRLHVVRRRRVRMIAVRVCVESTSLSSHARAPELLAIHRSIAHPTSSFTTDH